MYSLTNIKRLPQPVMIQQECEKFIEQHGFYVTYYEDRFPENTNNTQTVINMPMASSYEPAFRDTFIDQLTVIPPETDNTFILVKSEVVKYKSNSLLPPTFTEGYEANVCFIVCLKQQLDMPINIIMGLGTKFNTQTLSFNFMPGEALVYPCDIYNIYVDKLEDQISDQYLELSNIYLKYYYKIETTTQAPPPVQPDTTPDIPVPPEEQDLTIDLTKETFYNQQGEPYLYGQPYDPSIYRTT
jgi:hypothetical protein